MREKLIDAQSKIVKESGMDADFVSRVAAALAAK
jgi:hypothetical protein